MGVAVGGVVTTAYLAAKATWQARDVIDAYESENGVQEEPMDRVKERAGQTWPLYVPTVISGIGTITFIVFAQRSQARRTAAAVVAYTVTEKAFTDYREKVVEQMGKNKEQKLQDDIRQETVNANPPKTVIVTGGGEALCCELYTKRYFLSDVESLRRAVNDINAQVNLSSFALLDDFYERVGLPPTSQSNLLGWEGHFMDLQFSSILSEDNRPCIAFDYSPRPKLLWE